jgi:hypothetical protein
VIYNVRATILANAIWISQVESGRTLVGRTGLASLRMRQRWVSEPWVSSGETPGWAVQPWAWLCFSSATPDSILLQIVSARAGESGPLQSPARGRLCGESQCHHVFLGHGTEITHRRPTECAG